ncbi:c-type cytochrome [Arcobacter lacus]|uniref:c-type cytochrome n=1 Tax=Arcobacter lacus TaxID=1912876 RepID=UPI0021BB17EB|nr:c-type cytochrome [Arcobacter lacus]MCT7909879.1 c-type cytochrome [Arcobacter lacus]MCT7911909.1 c-type cytochrome [Arcobacter lacus]
MNRILLGSAIAVLLLSGCTEDKKESSTQTVTKEETTQKTNETSNNTVAESTNKIVEEKKAEVVKENITKDKVDEQVQNTQEIAVVTPDGETLYKVCASCHGQKAEKEALGKSQVIAGWDKERIINAMNGYKNGTYGGIMKNIMKPQVETKTDEEIEILATYISNIK